MRSMIVVSCCALVCLTVTASVAGETVFAVGTIYEVPKVTGGFHSEALILRSSGSEWERVALPSTATGFVTGMVFADSDHAWAFGMKMGGLPLLLSSSDGGRNWEDRSGVLNVPMMYLDDMAFADSLTGWIVGGDSTALRPYISKTRDGGATWSPFEGSNVGNSVAIGFAVLDGGIEVMRTDSRGTRLLQVEGARLAGTPDRVGDSEQRFEGLASYAADGQVWLVGVQALPPDPSRDRPAIYTAGRGQAATSEAIDFDGVGRLLSIDVRDGLTGVAGGVNLGDGAPGPLILHNSKGDHWASAQLPEGLDLMVVKDVLVGRDIAWAATARLGEPGSALLRSDDDGVTWERVSHPYEKNGHLFGVSTAPE